MGLNADSGLSYTDAEWIAEWQGIVDMASAHPRSQMSTSYQSLEEVYKKFKIKLKIKFKKIVCI